MAEREFDWEQIDEILRLGELTSEELQILQAQEAMLKLQKNGELLARVNDLLLEAMNELGRWKVIVEKLRYTKNTIVEQNRVLKEILKAERY